MDGGPMDGHVVIAPDKFKGSLTAAEAAHAISVGIKRGYPALATVLCPGPTAAMEPSVLSLQRDSRRSLSMPKGRQARWSTLRMPVVARPLLSKWRKSVACNGFPAACPLL